MSDAQGSVMRGVLLTFALSFGSLLLVQCGAGSSEVPPQSIHPQPQPNNRQVTFTAPCSAAQCGDAPGTIASPRCKQEPSGCLWSDSTSVSFRQCAETECGAAPNASVCAPGTIFRGSTCGSENERACAWHTACAPPPSTTPCAKGDGECGPMPLLGVVCDDGGTGGLVCMQFERGCNWQASCD